MAKIEDLPDEVLSDIFSYLRLDFVTSPSTPHSEVLGTVPRATIPARTMLALVCKRFHAIAVSQLYEHVVVGSPAQIQRLVQAWSSKCRGKDIRATEGVSGPKMRSFTLFPRQYLQYWQWVFQEDHAGRRTRRNYNSLQPFLQNVCTLEIRILRSFAAPWLCTFAAYMQFLPLANPAHAILYTDICPVSLPILHHTNTDTDARQLAAVFRDGCTRLESLDVMGLTFPCGDPSCRTPDPFPAFLHGLSSKAIRRLRLESPQGLSADRVSALFERLKHTLEPGGLKIVAKNDWYALPQRQFVDPTGARLWFERQNNGLTLAELEDELSRRECGELRKFLTWDVGDSSSC